MDMTAVKKAIYDWVVLALSTPTPPPIYWGDQNAPRPDNPSVRLKFIAGPNMVGLDEIRDVEGDPDLFAIVGPRTFLLSVTGQGDTAINLVSQLQTSVSDPSKVAKLGEDGVSILSIGTSRDVTQLMETKYETRHQVDVNLLVTEYVETELGVIEDLELGSTLETPAGDEIDGGFTTTD
jgi:hypothetical protein